MTLHVSEGAGVGSETAAQAGLPADAVRPPPAKDRRAEILHGPIVPVMLRLGLPTLLVLAVQALVGVAETYFVSYLGTQAVAGVALVFPVFMLMLTMANGGVGGGVSSAVARAIGAGRRHDAEALASQALLLAVACGLVFMVAVFLAGGWLYRAMGGEGEALDAALTYSTFVFLGAIPTWILSLLSGALRGSGNVKVPAVVIFTGALAMLALSPVLIFGLGPLPAFGVAGAGVAVALYNSAVALVLIFYLASGRGTLRFGPFRPNFGLLRDIMAVGGLAAVNTVQSNLTVVLVTAAVGFHGTDAIAAYGIASRLDYLLIPLLFGFGTASVTMVGTAVGAGQIARARRVAWTGAALGGVGVGLIGLVAAVFPLGWAAAFSSDPAVLASSVLYLRTVAPFYVVYGAGMMLYFAAQGAGRLLVPFLAGLARLLLAGGVGFLAARAGAGEFTLFAIVAASYVVFGLGCAGATWMSNWGRGT